MKKNKKNCWEIMGCGRELGGERAYVQGVCPASTDISLDGVHGGEHAGRACWVVTGTMCSETIHGAFLDKIKTCGECNFYLLIKEEESFNFLGTIALLKKIEED